MPKRGLLSNFRLIVPEGEIEPEVPANIYLFICLMDDGNWPNMTFRSMTYFNAYVGMKSMMTCINLRID